MGGNTGVFLLRMVVALLLGTVIGLERQLSRQMAGIRTNALISFGACIFCQLSYSMSGEGDVFRVVSAVVTGIGFLGGGVIVRDGFTIKGLTTAATMWCTAAIGATVAGGLFLEAIVATVMILAINILLHPVSSRIKNMREHNGGARSFQYNIIVACANEDALHLRGSLGRLPESSRVRLAALETLPSIAVGSVRLVMQVLADREDDMEVERLMAMALAQPGVTSASWEKVGDST